MIFRQKGEAFAAGCIQFYKDNHDLCYYYYYYVEHIKVDKFTRVCSMHGEKKNALNSSEGTFEERRPLENWNVF